MGYTIATHNGSAVARDHNIRNEKVVSKESHINPDGIHETWIDEKPRQAYERLFGKAVEDYNNKQTRTDRKITSYYNDICKDAKKHPVYEMIVSIGNRDNAIDEQTGKQILREFVDSWGDRNPNLELIGAYYHADEEGVPHVHCDYVPVAHRYTRGMETQTGLVKALGEMGFQKQGKATAQILWEHRENDTLETLCKAHDLIVDHPAGEKRAHMHTETYKARQTLQEARRATKKSLSDIKYLKGQKDTLESEIEVLKDTKNAQGDELNNLLKQKNALDREIKALINMKNIQGQVLSSQQIKNIKTESIILDSEKVKINKSDLASLQKSALLGEQADQIYKSAKAYLQKAENTLKQAEQKNKEPIPERMERLKLEKKVAIYEQELKKYPDVQKRIQKALVEKQQTGNHIPKLLR